MAHMQRTMAPTRPTPPHSIVAGMCNSPCAPRCMRFMHVRHSVPHVRQAMQIELQRPHAFQVMSMTLEERLAAGVKLPDASDVALADARVLTGASLLRRPPAAAPRVASNARVAQHPTGQQLLVTFACMQQLRVPSPFPTHTKHRCVQHQPSSPGSDGCGRGSRSPSSRRCTHLCSNCAASLAPSRRRCRSS